MRVIMFDRQSIFIHGAIQSLQKLIPEIDMTGTSQADELWAQLSASPAAIVMIDGDLIQKEGIAFLEEIIHRFPALRVVMVLAKKESRWIEQVRQTGDSHVAHLNPADRRIVHKVAQEYSDIRTFSEGEGRERRIIIAQKSS